MAISEQLKSTVGRAMGRIPSGLFIVSAMHDGVECAQLASWVQQAAFDPPTLSLALARERQISAIIRNNGLFAVSILAEGNHTLLKKYARGVEPSPDAFASVSVRRSPQGLPILADALAFLECKLVHVCDFASDHELLIGQVLSGELLKDGKSFIHTRGNGFHY